MGVRLNLINSSWHLHCACQVTGQFQWDIPRTTMKYRLDVLCPYYWPNYIKNTIDTNNKQCINYENHAKDDENNRHHKWTISKIISWFFIHHTHSISLTNTNSTCKYQVYFFPSLSHASSLHLFWITCCSRWIESVPVCKENLLTAWFICFSSTPAKFLLLHMKLMSEIQFVRIAYLPVAMSSIVQFSDVCVSLEISSNRLLIVVKRGTGTNLYISASGTSRTVVATSLILLSMMSSARMADLVMRCASNDSNKIGAALTCLSHTKIT